MEELSIRHITDDADLDRAFKLREVVFIDEQGVSREAEFDGLDATSQHLLAMLGDRAVGTLRIRPLDDGLAKIERVVVLKSERGQRIGAALINAAIQLVQDLGIRVAKLHAQTHAEGFYARLGFSAYGDIFDEDGLPHIAMRNDLVGQSEEREC